MLRSASRRSALTFSALRSIAESVCCVMPRRIATADWVRPACLRNAWSTVGSSSAVRIVNSGIQISCCICNLQIIGCRSQILNGVCTPIGAYDVLIRCAFCRTALAKPLQQLARLHHVGILRMHVQQAHGMAGLQAVEAGVGRDGDAVVGAEAVDHGGTHAA